MNPCRRVNLVIDANFGTALLDLPANEPVWIADTPGNGEAIRTTRRLRSGTCHLTGVTSFRIDPTDDPADCLRELLPVIEEHHGGQIPPLDALRIFGCPETGSLREELLGRGFHFQACNGNVAEFVKPPGGPSAGQRDGCQGNPAGLK